MLCLRSGCTLSAHSPAHTARHISGRWLRAATGIGCSAAAHVTCYWCYRLSSRSLCLQAVSLYRVQTACFY